MRYTRHNNILLCLVMILKKILVHVFQWSNITIDLAFHMSCKFVFGLLFCCFVFVFSLIACSGKHSNFNFSMDENISCFRKKRILFFFLFFFTKKSICFVLLTLNQVLLIFLVAYRVSNIEGSYV